jgi:integrase/recombinase XerC
MSIKPILQRTESIARWISAFMVAKRVQNAAPGTLKFYVVKLQLFQYYAVTHDLELETMTPADIRGFMAWLAETGHNVGGQACAFRAVRSFLYWCEAELENGWKAPIRKCKPPKLSQELLPPVSERDVKALLDQCGSDLQGKRNRAIILSLVDTGLRASELLSLNIGDVDLLSGSILASKTKNGKSRVVFLGKQSRKALRSYLNYRKDNNEALFVTRSNERVTYSGLRDIVKRLANMAGIAPPQLHGFRRYFCLSMLRHGCSLVMLKQMSGHSSYQVLERYLALATDDLAQAHALASPGDKL